MSTSISSTGIVTPSLSSTIYNGRQLAGFRNKIINGDFTFWQRGTSIGQVGGSFIADRWRNSGNSSGTTAIQRVRTIASLPLGKDQTYCMQWSQSSASSNMGIEQRIEGVETLSGKTATLSFYLRLNSGSLDGSLVSLTQVFGTGGSANVTAPSQNLEVSITPDFNRYSFTFEVPSILSKTIGTSDFLGLLIALPPSGNWNFDITGVQLEEGEVATPFEFRPLALEALMCFRYYQRLTRLCPKVSGFSNRFIPPTLFTPMRGTPTLSGASGNVVTEFSSGTLYNASIGLSFIETTGTPTYDIIFDGHALAEL